MILRTYQNWIRKTVTGWLVLVVTMSFGVSSIVQTTHASKPIATESPSATPQQEEGWTTIKTNDGVMFVWNVRGLYFTLAINGKEIKPLEDPDHVFFSVDGQVLQIQTAALSNFAADAKEKKLDDKGILLAHRDWETKYIEDLIHAKIAVRTFNTKLSNGSDALMWQFDMPAGMNNVAQKQVYLTLVARDYVLMLNSEATATFSDADGRKFLLETIATLKLSPTPIDVKQLSESISKGAKP